MMNTFDFREVKKSKKEFICDWCNKKIPVGARRFTIPFAEDGILSSVHMHPICFYAKKHSGHDEWCVWYAPGRTDDEYFLPPEYDDNGKQTCLALVGGFETYKEIYKISDGALPMLLYEMYKEIRKLLLPGQYVGIEFSAYKDYSIGVFVRVFVAGVGSSECFTLTEKFESSFVSCKVVDVCVLFVPVVVICMENFSANDMVCSDQFLMNRTWDYSETGVLGTFAGFIVYAFRFELVCSGVAADQCKFITKCNLANRWVELMIPADVDDNSSPLVLVKYNLTERAFIKVYSSAGDILFFLLNDRG